MFNHGVGLSARPVARWAIAIGGIMLAQTAFAAAPGDNVVVVRDLASRVGPIVGAALACQDIAQSRIQQIADKFRAVIRETATNESERADISAQFDRYVTDGRSAITLGRSDCRTADRQLAELERSIAVPSLAAVIG